MPSSRQSTFLLGLAAFAVVSSAHAKPLKVFILAGQSNMEGHAQTMTFPAIAKDLKTADWYKARPSPKPQWGYGNRNVERVIES